jgi:outer membrane protein
MKRLIHITLLSIAITTTAQEIKKNTYSFSLQQAIDHGILNNYSAINSNRDIEIAKHKKWETTTIGLPQINGAVDYQNFIKQPVALADFNQDGIDEEFVFGTKQNLKASATLTQLLFDGSYLVGLQAAKVYLKISENAKIKTNQEIREIIINSYGNVLLAEESILIFQKNETILEKTLFETSETFKNGLIEEENVEQLQITLTSVKSALANVKRQKRIALNMLKLLLGINIEDELLLTEKLDILTQNNVDLQLLQKQFNASNAIDYQIGQNLEDSKKLLLKLEKSKSLPTLGAFLNYGVTANNDRFKFVSQNQKWFGSSLFGVSLSVPIFSSFGRSSRTQQAKIALEQATTNLIEIDQKLRLQFEKAKSDYEFSIEQLNTNKTNLKLAERIENKQGIKFKEGLSSSFNLNEAQRQLYSAQQTYLQSMVDIIVKKAALEKIIN